VQVARLIISGIAIAAAGVLVVGSSEASETANGLLVAPNANPTMARALRGARIGERSTITVTAGPRARRVTFYVDDLQTSHPGAVRSRRPFSLGQGSRAGDAALTPGRHLLAAKIEYLDGRSTMLRAPYTVIRLYLSPSGQDSNPCTQAAPCRSLGHGYRVAPPGGIVEVAEGTYGCEPIVGNRMTAVALRGAAGAFPRTECGLDVRAPWLKLERVNISGQIAFLPGSDNSSLTDGTATSFNIFGADDVSIIGNTFDGNGQVSNNQIWDEPAGSTPDRFRILNNTIKNFYGPTEADHSEGIFVGYSTDGLIAGNTLENNGNTAHIFFTWFGGQAAPSSSSPRNICVRGNRFGATHGAYYAVAIREEIPVTAGIRIARPPSNTVTGNIGLSSSKGMVSKTC
jgi:hypothetical protein